MLAAPLNLQAWIEEHRHLLKPPVGNKCIYDGDFIVMVVGGPNARTDFHYDEGPEWFYQLEGEMVLKVQEEGQVRDIPIRAGEMFLLPGKVRHSPRRMAGSVGLVVERRRLVERHKKVVRRVCLDITHRLVRCAALRSRLGQIIRVDILLLSVIAGSKPQFAIGKTGEPGKLEQLRAVEPLPSQRSRREAWELRTRRPLDRV